MTPERFNQIFVEQVDECRKTLVVKSVEYSRDGDRLWNFKEAAKVDDEIPERSLWGMYKKHLISVKDIIRDIERSGKLPSVASLEEKIKDSINYHILLKALIMERMETSQTVSTSGDAIEFKFGIKPKRRKHGSK
jgi:hypothetical protein